MSTSHLFVLSIPGLRPSDIDRNETPTLYQWANSGAAAELVPTFPCVTSPVQATMWTGTPPSKHGVIANGFYDRRKREVSFWVAGNEVIAGEPIWDALRREKLGFTSAAWHGQNIKGASADFIVTPAPIHEPDGTTKLWCYSKPESLYPQLLDALGHFPLQHYWGPLANVQSTKWILEGAAWLAARSAPNLHWVYIPHLDYAGQKSGPNSLEARASVRELDGCLARFANHCGSVPALKDLVFLIVGEYAMVDVCGVVYPNRKLRESGMLAVECRDGREYIDWRRSQAFAMVDHQFAHLYVHADPGLERERAVGSVEETFRDLPGVAGVFSGERRREIGMGHPRAGDVVLVCEESHWMAYYWWLDEALAPPYARTVDIHRKPGYDPVELFFDPVTKGIPLDATLVKGSHGVPATAARHRTALICSSATGAVKSGRVYRDSDLKRICLELLGVATA